MRETLINRKLRACGYTFSRQRRAVLEALSGMSGRHPTAEEVHAAASERYPALALGTVYQALAVFSEAGLVAARQWANSKVHYDLDLSPHVDIRCRRCGRVERVPGTGRDAAWLAEVVGDNVPYREASFLGMAEGVCPACRTTAAGTSARHAQVEGEEKVLAFDLETRMLAAEVEREYAAELKGAAAWTRGDLFGFGCGVIVDVATGIAYRYGSGEAGAKAMIEHLSEADMVVSYNGESFDLRVLSAHGDVSLIRQKHLDLNVLVRRALDALEIDRQGTGRIRQGGLDGVAKANGLEGKSGHATDAPALLRAGEVEKVLAYCEQDVRIVVELYRRARQTGKLAVDGYLKKGKERIELGRLEAAMEVAGEIPAFACDACGETFERYQLFPAGDGYGVLCEMCEEEVDNARLLTTRQHDG